MNKKDIVQALEDSHEEILQSIDGLSDEELLEPGVVGQWSLKDVLAHLTRWEAELIKLLWQIQQSMRPTSMLLDIKDYDEINARWSQEDQERPLERILDDFHSVREQTLRRLEPFKDNDLFNPDRYPWLNGKALIVKLEGNTFGHDREHLEQIAQWRKNKK